MTVTATTFRTRARAPASSTYTLARLQVNEPLAITSESAIARLQSQTHGKMGKQDNNNNDLLTPTSAASNEGEGGAAVSRRRSFIRNPFKSSSSSQDGGAGESRLARAFSSSSRGSSNSNSNNAAQQRQPEGWAGRNPMQNRSEATRRPRAQSPPPEYSRMATQSTGPTLGTSPAYERFPTAATASTTEDAYAFLSTFDTVFLIDDSGSMAGRLWDEVLAAINVILPICAAHDEDGIDVYFLNKLSGEKADPSSGCPGTGYRNIRSLDSIRSVFAEASPELGAGTLTGKRLGLLLRSYTRYYQRRLDETGGDDACVKPLNIIVITDGVPADDVAEPLVAAAQKLDRLDAPNYQVGVQFFQVGEDREATRALKALDDELGEDIRGGVRDIVDTVSFDPSSDGRTMVLTGDTILKTVLGAVVKKLDRKPSAARAPEGAAGAGAGAASSSR